LTKTKPTKTTDIWSMGYILFTMLRGILKDRDDFGFVDQQMFYCDGWDHITAETQWMVFQLLHSNPEERPSIMEVLDHHFEVDVHSNEWETARTKTMICGYLRIRNRFEDHSYKRCVCVLRNEAIYCYPSSYSSNERNDDQFDHKLMNCFSLDTFDVIQWSPWDNVKFQLSTKGSGMEWAAPIEHDGHCLIFEAMSPEECKQWRMHLSKDTLVKKPPSRDPDDRYKGAFRGHGDQRRERRHGLICTGRTFPTVFGEMLQNRYRLSY